MLNATMLKNDAAHRCAHVRRSGNWRLRPCSRASEVSVTAPRKRLATRILKGGISLRAMRIIGQVVPQPRHSATRESRALMTSDLLGALAGAPARGLVWCGVMGGRGRGAMRMRPDRPDAIVLPRFTRVTMGPLHRSQKGSHALRRKWALRDRRLEAGQRRRQDLPGLFY